jgi:acetolactate synthase-1/2/3 large subunit
MIGDGSAMYTNQSLWTMAREGLDICVMIFSNRSYKILYSQLADVGAANPGPRARDMLTLDRPAIDFAMMAKSMGVPGGQAHDLEELTKQLSYAMSQRGPYLVDVVM